MAFSYDEGLSDETTGITGVTGASTGTGIGARNRASARTACTGTWMGTGN
jgi:hypothetical protein